MKISITRSGGFAGTSQYVADVDTSRLSGDVALEIERILAWIGFFDLPSEVPDGAPGADFFRFEITVVDGERRHSVAFNDSGGPIQRALREFVAYVTKAATNGR